MADEYIDKVEVGAKIQMMYIRREMDYGGENDFCRGMRKALRIIENMPAADVKPVKYSSWEYRTYPIVDRDGVARRCMRGYVCKACGHGEPEEKRFCGGCGAEMRNE